MQAAHDLTWREYEIHSGYVVLAKRCACRASFDDTAVISVHRVESRVDLFLYQGNPVREVLKLKPSSSIVETGITPAAIYQIIGQDDTERVIGEIAGIPFSDLYPASRYIDSLLEKWRTVRYPGWIYSTLGTRGFALLKDINSFDDGRLHTVEVSDRGVSIYKSGIQDGCALLSDDRMLFMDTEVIGISPETIAELCGWAHSYEICGVQRAIRRFLFHAVLAKSS